MNEINLKAFDNVITGTHEECENAWHEAIGDIIERNWQTYGGDTINEWCRFSMFDTVDDKYDDPWIVTYPDFKANPLICEGELKIKIIDWNEASTILTNPRINDVFRFFANNHDGHHGFLECVNYEDGVLTLHGGS